MERPLAELQGSVKKDPELYKETVQELIEEFTGLISTFPETPSAPNERLSELVSFLAQISPYFLSELKHFPSQLLNILNNYYSALDRNFRKLLFAGLTLLRNREQIPAMSILPICFKLFRCQDKELRASAFMFIVKDIKKINKHTHNNQINSQLQSFIYEMIEDSNVTAAKKSLHVLMTLYKKRVWIDTRTVNVIANSCLLKESKLVMIGCTFLLVADTDEFKSDSDSDEEKPDKNIIGARKTKGKLNQRERAVKNFEKKNRRKEKKADSKEPCFLTIDQLNDAQGFVEKLLHNLQKVFSRGKHELQVVMLQVIARIVGRHKLMLIDLYPFIQKFVTPKSQKVTQMLIICAEATHELVPPQELAPVIKKILDNFLSEHCSEEFIVLGMNCMREICKRQPLVMTKELLEHINTFKTFKNKSVVMATSSLINLYKEIRPSLLRNKLRSGEEDLVGEYGEIKVYTRVPGAELLEAKNAQQNFGNQQVVIIQPQQKSENLLRLERVLQEKAMRNEDNPEDLCRKKTKLEDQNSEGESEEEENEGSIEESEREESGEEMESDDEMESGDEMESDDEEESGAEESEEEGDVEEPIDEENLDEPIVEAGYISGAVPYECDHIMTQSDFNRIKQLKREAEARRRRMDVNLLESSSDGEFISSDDLDTMKVSKEEKTKLCNDEKGKRRRERKKKSGGKTNREHAKSKPAMMVVKKKKDKMREKFAVGKRKIKRSKQQLGKFSKRFSATKRQLG